MSWDRFVDVVTIIWLLFFALGSFNPGLETLCSTINLSLLPVFIADLIIKYKRVGNAKYFLKHHWLDILTAIPYFRFLRVFRIVRAVRAVRGLKASKTLKSGKAVIAAKTMLYTLKKAEKIVKALKKAKRLVKYIKTSTKHL